MNAQELAQELSKLNWQQLAETHPQITAYFLHAAGRVLLVSKNFQDLPARRDYAARMRRLKDEYRRQHYQVEEMLAPLQTVNGETFTAAYAVDCPHFGKFLSAGGCSCGSGNVHECALDGTTKRSACQKCFHNRAPQYARLIVAEGCPDCAELKVALLERIGAERVKEILLNRNGKVRCRYYDETGGKPHFDRDTNMSHVASIRDELTKAHYPAEVFAPLLLLPDGELLTRPAEIAAKIAELSA